ncbi:MAG TPA: nuclear transport factor 2 family protein [Pyrinomonadaceae bacterium]
MKRILLAAALLAAASAPACTPTTGPANNSNAPANSNAAATPTPAPTVAAADHIAREKQVMDAIKRKDWDAFAAHLADDQLYVSTDGVHDKAATLASIKKLDITEYTSADARVVQIDRDLVVVTHTTTAKGTFDGKPIPAGSQRESTAWANRGGRWLAVYHQDSEVMTPPTPTPGAPTPAATAVATPVAAASATPAATPANSTELEQQIWDTLKRKDWDAFAAHLAADAVEVGATGVYDKAGTVNAVKQVDFTGATLSDFKEVKIDADATLLIYTAKGPRAVFGPNGERSATIHANRSGRWLAVFHQATSIK